jgi:CxxC motif-containing protein
MKKEIICTVCPMGCRMTVTGKGDRIDSVEGNGCKRGFTYAQTEFAHPVRILTSTVKTGDPAAPLMPVRSSQPVPKEKMTEIMAAIREVRLSQPVRRYDVILPDVCGTGIDIVATGQSRR